MAPKSSGPYLPRFPDAAEADAYLFHATGERWPMERLLEEGHLIPSVHVPWNDHPDLQPLFEQHRTGLALPVCFHDDLQAILRSRTGVLTYSRLPDGRFIQFDKSGLQFDLTDLRFRREDIENLATRGPDPTGPDADGVYPWKELARQYAGEKHLDSQTHRSITLLSVDVAKRFAKEGRRTLHGRPISAENIERYALRGWQRPPKRRRPESK
jgi:hypothetical protein